MVKRLGFLTAFMLLFSSICLAQAVDVSRYYRVTSVVAFETIELRGRGIYNHRITWTGLGTRTSGTGKLEKSVDGSNWTDLIGAQSLTTDGTATATGYCNFVRVNITALSGSGNTVYIRYDGSPVAPAAGTVTIDNAAQETGGNLSAAATALGSKTDAKSTATDATSISIVQVLKEISYTNQLLAAVLNSSVSMKVTPYNSSGTELGPLTSGTDSVTAVLASSTTNPCSTDVVITLPIAQATSTQLIAVSGSTQIYVCGGVITSQTAEVVNFWEGTGTVCASNKAVLVGSGTAADGVSIGSAITGATNGGFIIPTGGFRTNTAGRALCLIQSSTAKLAGYITYIQK